MSILLCTDSLLIKDIFSLTMLILLTSLEYIFTNKLGHSSNSSDLDRFFRISICRLLNKSLIRILQKIGSALESNPSMSRWDSSLMYRNQTLTR